MASCVHVCGVHMFDQLFMQVCEAGIRYFLDSLSILYIEAKFLT